MRVHVAMRPKYYNRSCTIVVLAILLATYLKLLECYNGSSGSRLPQSKGVIGRVFPISQQGERVESI